jgi:hypothetical protein
MAVAAAQFPLQYQPLSWEKRFLQKKYKSRPEKKNSKNLTKQVNQIN